MTPDARAALTRSGFSRRDFLKQSGALIVSFSALGVAIDTRSAFAQVFQGVSPGAPAPNQLDSWIAIATDGSVTGYTGKSELGQGIVTAQTQLVAEELCVPFERVKLIFCDTDFTPDQGYTSGSQSHPTNFNHENLAQACATAREALVKLASDRLGVPADQLVAANGAVSSKSDPSKKIGYGDLIGGKKFNLTLDKNAKRKPASEWTVLGTPVHRPDLPALVTAHFELRAQRARSGNAAWAGGSSAGSGRHRCERGRSFRQQNARRGKSGREEKFRWRGHRKTLASHSGCHPTQSELDTRDWPADLRRFLRPPAQPEAHARYAAGQFEGCRSVLRAAAAQPANVVKATYHHPYQMHGSMGSSCAVADVQNGKATLWSATQGVWYIRSTAAMVLGLKPEDVHVIFTRGSGCYGINGADSVTYDAAILSQAVGKPVRVQLTRKDEMAWENYGNAAVIDERAVLDAQGNIIAWDHESWVPVCGNRPGRGTPGNIITGMLAGFEPEPFAPRAPAPEPNRYNNDSNGIPSYVAGSVGGRNQGTGNIKSERVLVHNVVSPFWTGPCAPPSACRTPSRTNRSWTRLRPVLRPIQWRSAFSISAISA